jgi:phenylpropionate dioxygenase-like ring-hydroxylating dioxygenase large terminal subunit
MAFFSWKGQKPEDEFLYTRPRFKTDRVKENTTLIPTEMYAPPPERVEPRTGKGASAEKAPDFDFGSGQIPSRRYTSRAFMERERRDLWPRSWLMAARERDIQKPGDFVLFSIGYESVIIVRQWDDSIKAFFNVSPHRGNRLIPDDAQARRTRNAATFKSRLDHWEWDINGTLKTAPDPETFSQGIPADTLGLTPVKCDLWGGWVFINLNPEAEPLHDFLEVIPEHLNCYNWEGMVHTTDKTVEWPCNWKTAMDVLTETYSVKALHPQLLPWTEDYHVQIDTYGRHSRSLIPFYVPATRHVDQNTIAPEAMVHLEKLGIHPRNFDGRPAAARRAIQKAKRDLQERMPHLPYRFLNDEQLTDNYQYTMFPNVVANMFADYVLLLRVRPHTDDPNKCYCDVQTLAHQDPKAPKERPLHSSQVHGEAPLGTVLDQKASVLEDIQLGMRSKGFDGQYLSDQEVCIRHFQAVLMAYLGESPEGETRRTLPSPEERLG